MEQGISYLNKTYADYKEALIDYSKKYYPDFNVNYDDASVAAWMIGINAAVADDLSYYIDRTYQETSIDSAQEKQSLFNLARNKGVKIPGPKGAMAEVQLTCTLGMKDNAPDWSYAPVIKRGTRVASSTQQFEVMEDIDFALQFNEDGESDRTFVPHLNASAYTVSKLATVVAGETRIYRQTLAVSDVKPFMEIILPVQDVMNVESVLVVDGDDDTEKQVPTYGAFYMPSDEKCGNTTRYFEVDYLSQQELWSDALDNNKRALKYTYGYNTNGSTTPMATYCITKGEWRPVKHKFITEYTDNGYLKIIFGAGNGADYPDYGSSMADFSKAQISRIINNDALGVLPAAPSTVYVLYRLGGGRSSNVAAGAINKIAYLNGEFRGSNQQKLNAVKSSLRIVNTTPSISGKDMPTNEEIRFLIKYSNAAKERCVTVKDYVERLLRLPSRYGTPFRIGVMEENNKIMVYLLGLNHIGQLDTLLPVTLVKNIEKYLTKYRMINDYVEIKAGRIINLSFEADVIVDKNYNKTDIASTIISTIREYMDVNKHIMGEEIYVGDLEKEISKVDGVLNLIGLRVFNEMGNGYSQTQIGQPTISYEDEDGRILVDLEATDGVLYNEGDSMMEIKNPAVDIKVKMKER